MRTFKDNANREWTIDLTIGAMNRVRDDLGIDLLAPHDKPGDKSDERARNVKFKGRQALLISVLNLDASLLFDVIYVILKPQLEKAQVSQAEFVESMGGDAAYNAYKSFHDEWSDFFQHFHRPDAAKMIQKHVAMIEAQAIRDEALVEKVEKAVVAEMKRESDRLEENLEAVGNGQKSMDSLVSSESTQSI
jgi:hypothetical protein